MPDYNIIMPSKPRIVLEEGNKGVFEMDGLKEDVIVFILNMKKIRFKMLSDEPQTVTLSIKGPREVLAGDIKTGGQVEILNPEMHIAEVNGKVNLNIEINIE